MPLLLPGLLRMTISYANGFVTICWPLISRGYVLEQSDSLVSPDWTQVESQPSETDACRSPRPKGPSLCSITWPRDSANARARG